MKLYGHTFRGYRKLRECSTSVAITVRTPTAVPHARLPTGLEAIAMRKPPTLRKLTQLLIPTVAVSRPGAHRARPPWRGDPGFYTGAPKSAPRSAPAPQPASATVLAADLAPGHTADPARSASKASKASKASNPAQRPPLPAAQNAAERKQARSAAKAAADCNVSDFTAKTGAALVEQIKKSETTCINTLFGVTGEDSKALFREEQMVTVANALKDVAANYPGDNSTFATQVVLYLRAGLLHPVQPA